MQMLWAAELQARQFGVCGSDPFNPSQLPLLATMQFDGTQKGGALLYGSCCPLYEERYYDNLSI